MTKKNDDVFAPAEKPVFGPRPGTDPMPLDHDPESGREATLPPKPRAPRSDKGKPRTRPAPQTDRAVEHADKVIERMVELARTALVAIGDDARLANLCLEELIIIGEGGDLEAWLRSKVYP